MAPGLSFHRVSNVLEKVLPSYGLATRLAEWSLKLKWEQIVGGPVAAHSEPGPLNFKRLVIVVDCPAWVQHLTFLKSELTKKIQRSLGVETVTEIRFKVGSLSKNSPSQPFALPTRAFRAGLDEEEAVLIEEYLRPLQDPTLKEKLRSLITRSFLA
jgi:hypothetical protein